MQLACNWAFGTGPKGSIWGTYWGVLALIRRLPYCYGMLSRIDRAVSADVACLCSRRPMPSWAGSRKGGSAVKEPSASPNSAARLKDSTRGWARAAWRWAWAIAAAALVVCGTVGPTGSARAESPAAKPRPWLAPVPAERANSSHAPYDLGDCRACHLRSDPKDPGPPREAIPASCVACHEEVGTLTKAPRAKGKKRHPGPRAGCALCHNPHNSAKLHLLL